LKSEEIVQTTFSYLPKLAVKALELAVAGLASATAACLLAHMGTPFVSSTPLVEIRAANAEMMRMVRDEHALLVEMGKGLDIQKPEQAATAVMPVQAPAKPAQAAPLHNQRTQRTMPMDAKPRQGEPLPIGQTVPVFHSSKIVELGPTTMDPSAGSQPLRVSASAHTEGEGSSIGMLKRSPSPFRTWP
jgi:hypothetical protein